MSSQYQKTFAIPDGFPALLKDFTREILREQPTNIFEFGANYFTEKKRQARGAVSTSGTEKLQAVEAKDEVVEHDPADISHYMLDIFMSADKDQSGSLDRREFSALLHSAEVGLSERQIRQMLAECDDNENGAVEYREFVPLMMDLLAADRAATDAAADAHQVVEDMRANVEEFLIYGVPKQEMEDMMLRIFQQADTDGSGALDRAEFKACLTAVELGLSRKDINLLMSKVDVDHDNYISYSEFIPVCFSILVDRFTDQILLNAALQNDDLLNKELVYRFQAADPQGTGELSPHRVRLELQAFSYEMFSMSQYQIHAMLAVAPQHPSGAIDYMQFAPMATATMRKMIDAEHMKKRYVAIQALSETDIMHELAFVGADAMNALMLDAFAAADIDNSGTLTGREVANVLRELSASASGHEIHLEPGVWQSFMAAVDSEDDGSVNWSELSTFLFDIVKHIERERKIRKVEQQHANAESM